MDLDIIDRLDGVPEADFQYRSRAELLTFREQARSVRDTAFATCTRILDSAAGRSLTTPQQSDFDAAERRTVKAGQLAECVERALVTKALDHSGTIPGGNGYADVVGSRDEYRDDKPLTRSQTMAGWTRARGDVTATHEGLDLGKYLSGLVTGRWDSGSETERRAMGEGVLASGGYLVPTILSSQIVDLARNKTRVIEAGATLMPMANRIVDVAKWSGDPSSAWHSENTAITPTDATIGRVRFTAKTLPVLTVVSRELIEDTDNVGHELAQAIAKSFALKLDRAALIGSGVDPEPQGVKGSSGINVQSMGVNGAAPANFDPFVDAVGTLMDNNEQATGGIIVAPRTVRELNKLKDSQGRYLEPPPVLDGLPFLPTNQVPITNTQGTATTASDAFVADWRQLWVGVRTEMTLTTLTERYADFGQLAILAWARYDIQLARPAAFVNIVGIL